MCFMKFMAISPDLYFIDITVEVTDKLSVLKYTFIKEVGAPKNYFQTRIKISAVEQVKF